MKILLAPIILASCLALKPVPAQAQYPNKPVRLIIPFPTGGPSDSAARTIGQAISKSMGQPIIADSRPGASGLIAAQTVRNAAPDGYTLLWGVGSMLAIPLLQKSPSFDWRTDFTPVSIVGEFSFGMFVYPGLPVKSVPEFIAYARANPDKLNYVASALSQHMAAVQFMKATGTSMVRVPYKGGTQSSPDLIAGRVQVRFGATSIALQYVKDGQLRMLATLTPQRIEALPDVPTMAETGIAGLFVPAWQAVFGPANTPRKVVDRLAREVSLALQDPGVRRQYHQQVFQIDGSTPGTLAGTVKADLRAWEQFIRENDIPKE